MKKFLLTGVIGAIFVVGCADSQSEPQPETPATKTVKKVVDNAKKVLNPCERDKMTCLAECKLNYPTQDDDIKLKACVAKCYTIYAGCKTAEGAKEGYKKTKEISKKVYENTKEFINEHSN